MKKLFLCSMEECHLLYLLSAGNRLIADHLALFSQVSMELLSTVVAYIFFNQLELILLSLTDNYSSVCLQLFSELKDCERFQTVLTLSIMDDDKLKENTMHSLQHMLASDQNSLPKKLRKGLENFLQILSDN